MNDKEKMPVQDQSREHQMIQILGLINAKGRLGYDAEDKDGRKFEMKSTKTSFDIGRDVSISMINAWKDIGFLPKAQP